MATSCESAKKSAVGGLRKIVGGLRGKSGLLFRQGSLRGRREGIQPGTATEGFLECRTEVTQAAVADFDRDFSHVVFARLQQVGRLFHAELTQVLRDGLAGLSRENAAEIEMAATDLLAEFLQ